MNDFVVAAVVDVVLVGAMCAVLFPLSAMVGGGVFVFEMK